LFRLVRSTHGKLIDDLLQRRIVSRHVVVSDGFQAFAHRHPFEVRRADIRTCFRREIIDQDKGDIAVVIPNVTVMQSAEIVHLFECLDETDMCTRTATSDVDFYLKFDGRLNKFHSQIERRCT
jgi:hypothetical protein